MNISEEHYKALKITAAAQLTTMTQLVTDKINDIIKENKPEEREFEPKTF